MKTVLVIVYRQDYGWFTCPEQFFVSWQGEQQEEADQLGHGHFSRSPHSSDTSCLFSAGAVADIAGGQEELSVQYHILHRMCRVFTFYNIGPFLYNTNARYFDLNKNKSIYVNQLEDGSPTMLWNRCWGRFSCLKWHVVTSPRLPSTPAAQELTQAHCLRYSQYQC